MRFLDRGDKIIFGKCEKDAADQRFEKTQEFSDKNNLGITVICKDAPEMGEGISGTKMRELVANDKREVFLSHVPSHLSDSEKDRVWDIVSSEKKTTGVESSSAEPFTEILYRTIERMLAEKAPSKKKKKLEEDELEEVSTVGGGSMEVSAGKKKKKSMIREDEDEDEIVEMVMNHLFNSKGITYDNR
jgi:hypothetical protein